MSELLVTTRARLNDEYLDERGIMENVLVFNNACWAIGEIGYKVPKALMEATLIGVVKAIGEMLDQDMIAKKTMQNEDLINHFQKTVAIALGRLCILDAQ